MRFVLITLSVMLTAVAAAQPVEPASVEAAVKAAVDRFQPMSLPPRGQLRDWVVGIDAAGVDVSRAGGRVRDDLSLITAAHLYHFVRRAGGKPVLTRVDHTRAAGAGQVDSIAEAGAQVCVLIRFGESGGYVAVQPGAGGERANDARLAGALGEALGVESGEPTAADVAVTEALRNAEAGSDIAVCVVRLDCSADATGIDAAARKRCYENARRLYEGIRSYCAGAAARPDSPDKAIPDTLSSNTATRLERLVRSIWPEGHLADEHIEWFCRRFIEQGISNPSLVYFAVEAQAEQESVVLRGKTNAPLVARGLERALAAVGIARVDNQVQALPDRERLGEQLFGVCRVPMALTYNRPSGGRPQTQLFFGEPVFLLDLEGESYLLHAGDGYWGWVSRDAVEPLSAERFDAYMRCPRAAVRHDIEAERVRIPRGAIVRLSQAGEDECAILLPDGSTLSVAAASVTLCDGGGKQAAARVHAALDLLHTPYVFGGRSPLGLDCSGLAANVQSRRGVTLPRDARQQAPAGQLVATGWHRANIRPGDQVFFINSSGKVYHTGLALDAVHVIHCAPPCVQIGSFDPGNRLYDAELDEDLFMVKRP